MEVSIAKAAYMCPNTLAIGEKVKISVLNGDNSWGELYSALSFSFN